MIKIDPRTRRIIITDLTPSHKDKSKDVHGVGEILSKEEFDDYIRKKEEEDELRDLMSEYNTVMAGETHASNRRGFEIR